MSAEVVLITYMFKPIQAEGLLFKPGEKESRNRQSDIAHNFAR